MDVGLVTYKICDHNFECAKCPLDQGLRPGHSSISPEEVKKSQNTKVNRNRI